MLVSYQSLIKELLLSQNNLDFNARKSLNLQFSIKKAWQSSISIFNHKIQKLMSLKY